MNRVKIVSDGSPYNTKMLDCNGVEIAGIKSIVWSIDANNWGKAIVTFENVAVEVEGDLAE